MLSNGTRKAGGQVADQNALRALADVNVQHGLIAQGRDRHQAPGFGIHGQGQQFLAGPVQEGEFPAVAEQHDHRLGPRQHEGAVVLSGVEEPALLLPAGSLPGRQAAQLVVSVEGPAGSEAKARRRAHHRHAQDLDSLAAPRVPHPQLGALVGDDQPVIRSDRQSVGAGALKVIDDQLQRIGGEVVCQHPHPDPGVVQDRACRRKGHAHPEIRAGDREFRPEL
jgi:hypothetical protein